PSTRSRRKRFSSCRGRSPAPPSEVGLYPIENGVPDLCVIDPMAIDCEATTLPSTVSVTSFDVLAHVMVCQAPSLRLGPPGRVMRFCDPTKMHCACDFPPWGKSSILYCGVALADR